MSNAANNSADERAAFEVYMRARHPHVELYRRDVRSSSRFGQYCREFAQEMWELWQARAAASQPAAAAGQEAVAIVTETHEAREKPDLYTVKAKARLNIGGRLYTAPPAQVATRQTEPRAEVTDADASLWQYVAQHAVVVDASTEGMVVLTIARDAESGALEDAAANAVRSLAARAGESQ